MTVPMNPAFRLVSITALAAWWLCSAAPLSLVPRPASAQSPGAGRASPDTIPVGEWSDDWWYPEGRVRLFGQRLSLVAGVVVNRFTDRAARETFGAWQIDPSLDLYRPEHRGLSPTISLMWTGVAGAGERAGFFAPTIGVRHQLVESDRAHPLVPFVGAGVGPYFAHTSTSGNATVFGANATAGIELFRTVRLAARYDALRRVRGHDLSMLSLDFSVRMPPTTPRRARAKMHDYVPPPGVMLDVEGHRLHLVCVGSGRPTVVFDAGLADSWVAWEPVLPSLARTTRVCAYDRAGVAWSEPGPLPRTSRQAVLELHALLERAGIEPPIVLVGHSLGGFNVRLYAAEHPAEVAGLVLVDATHEDLMSRSPAAVREQQDAAIEQLCRAAEFAERGGRLLPVVPDLPLSVASRAAWHRARCEEFRATAESADQLRRADRSLTVPLVVVTGARSVARGAGPRARRAEVIALWDTLQAELARLSPQGTRMIAPRSGHYVQRDEPEIVIDAVRQVVERVRAASNP